MAMAATFDESPRPRVAYSAHIVKRNEQRKERYIDSFALQRLKLAQPVYYRPPGMK